MAARQIGDVIILEATGELSPGIKCVVVDVDENGNVLKAMSVDKDERLLKHGFLLEGDDYVIMQWNWSMN